MARMDRRHVTVMLPHVQEGRCSKVGAIHIAHRALQEHMLEWCSSVHKDSMVQVWHCTGETH